MTRRPAPAPSRDIPDPIVAAIAALRAAGHTTMRAGRDLRCWHCDAYGWVNLDGSQRTGTIFTKGCSK